MSHRFLYDLRTCVLRLTTAKYWGKSWATMQTCWFFFKKIQLYRSSNQSMCIFSPSGRVAAGAAGAPRAASGAAL